MLRKFVKEQDPDTHDARTALAFPRPSDSPQGGRPEGRQGPGRHHRLRERVDGLPGPYLLVKYRHSAVVAEPVHSTVQPLLLVQFFPVNKS